jgi:UDP-GlcNAc:undecaprenyl-phosphate/decaprenyl-phosphate GlcNAc-1-phosphate transferase
VRTPVVGVVALLVVLLATPLAMAAARRLGIQDRPGPLKPQAAPVPYLGGLAVFCGLAVAAGNTRPSLLLPFGLATALGVADDRAGLPAVARLVGQLAIGAAVVATAPVHLPGLIDGVLLVVVTLVVVNGTNFIDGLDLLATGVGAVAAVGFAVVLHGTGRQVAVALAAALVGFSLYNRPPARVYLGDGGSYLIGTALCVLLAEAWAPGVPTSTGVAALTLVAIPAAEVAFAVVRRFRGGAALTSGDRGHPYDRLVARGWPKLVASAVYVVVEAVLATGAVVAVHAGATSAAVAVALVAAGLLVIGAAAAGALTPDAGATT